ncbi:MAG: hypothetical protein OHK0039_28260 [Bacteroidia bacterium]
MKDWFAFRRAMPLLQRIEQHYAALQALDPSDLASRAVLGDQLLADAHALPGQVYYWMYPFYEGDFLRLVAALGYCGAMQPQQDDPASRLAFYALFRTVPMDVRLRLGECLQHPGLIAQADAIRDKIDLRRETLKSHLDKHFAN